MSGDDVKSPCISVCKMDDATGLCIGCLRTLDEIAAWSILDGEEKRAVIAQLPRRRAVHPEINVDTPSDAAR